MTEFSCPGCLEGKAIHRINQYPAVSAICFVITYPLGGYLSAGWRYPAFKQLGPEE